MQCSLRPRGNVPILHPHMYVYVHTLVHISAEARVEPTLISGVSLYPNSPYFVRQVLSINQKLTTLGGMFG